MFKICIWRVWSTVFEKIISKKRKLYIRYYLSSYGFMGLTKCINVQIKKNQTPPLRILIFFSTTPQTLKAKLCMPTFLIQSTIFSSENESKCKWWKIFYCSLICNWLSFSFLIWLHKKCFALLALFYISTMAFLLFIHSGWMTSKKLCKTHWQNTYARNCSLRTFVELECIKEHLCTYSIKTPIWCCWLVEDKC